MATSGCVENLQGRIAILKVHSRGKTLSKDVDFEKISRRTPGVQLSILLYDCICCHLVLQCLEWAS